MTFAAMENERTVTAMRLIDADALELRYEFGYDHYGILCVPLRDVNESIKKAKTVDAVPIVRCRDCKHFREYITVGTVCTKYVKSLGGREVGLRATGKDDFCNYGERKNDER